MNNNIDIDRKESYGFYYDHQLENELLTMSLHPNTYWGETENVNETKGDSSTGESTTSNKTSEWKSYTEDVYENTEWTDRFLGVVPGTGYSRTPILKTILTDDFTVNVGNSWSDIGNNAIGQAWEGMKSLGPFAGFASKAFSKMAEQSKNYKGENMSKKVTDTMSNIFEKAASMSDKTKDYFNKALIVQGSQFSYYSGTAVSFSNLNLKYTVFPKFDEKSGRIIDVNEQLEQLYPYLLGSYEKDSTINDLFDKSVKAGEKTLKRFKDSKIDAIKKGTEIVESALKSVRDYIKSSSGEGFWDTYDIESYIGWQNPPGGYESALKGIDCIQKGTLMLRFGPYYRITNLVVSDASFNFSKQMVKYPNCNLTANSSESEVAKSDISVTPLFCEVNLSLRPCCKYSDVSLKRMIAGIAAGSTLLGDAKSNLESLRASRDGGQ